MRPWLEEAENRRAFVIISDAFRYEAAQELTQELNGKYRFEATLTSQLGVLPSYTALGMASLLPHKTLAYKGDGDVLVDGKSEHRRANGTRSCSRGRAWPARPTSCWRRRRTRAGSSSRTSGSSTSTTTRSMPSATTARPRSDTFEAVRKAINELAALVGYIINNLNGNHIVVTADHGFLFTETPPARPTRASWTTSRTAR